MVIAIVSFLSTIVLGSLNDAREKGRIAAGQKFSSSLHHAIGDQLIGEWLFNDSGTPASAADTSGWENDGAITGATYETDSVMGNVMSFDGTDDRITLPALVVNSGVCNLTLSAWSYNKGMPSTGNQGGVIAGTSNGWANIQYRDDRLRFELRNSSVGNLVQINGNYVDKWMHTALVLDNGQTYGYIDGRLVWTGADIGCIGLTNWQIGNWDRFFNGTIDDVRAYSKALTSAQIQKHYAEGLADHLTLASN